MTTERTHWTCQGCKNTFPAFGVDRPEYHDHDGHLYCCGLCTGKYGTRRARFAWRLQQRNTAFWRLARRIERVVWHA